MAYNYQAAQGRVHAQIAKFGGGENNGVLIRNGVERSCTVGILDWKPREAQLRLDGSRRALVSAKNLDTEPHHEQDMLKFNPTGELYRIVAPVSGPRPAGIPLFYDLEIMYDSKP